jgi:hypothetical protein
MAFCNVENNPLKDERGKYRTYSLFIERPKEGYECYWTLLDSSREIDGIVYPSLKEIYLSYEHIPGYEYQFAIDNLKSWDHWVKLTQSGMKQVFAEWREELEIKLKADAIRAMVKASKGEGASATGAAKYLADKGYSVKRGRPSKEEVEKERRIAAGITEELDSDYERMGLGLVINPLRAVN